MDHNLMRAFELANEQYERWSDALENNFELTLKEFLGSPFEVAVSFRILSRLNASNINPRNNS